MRLEIELEPAADIYKTFSESLNEYANLLRKLSDGHKATGIEEVWLLDAASIFDGLTDAAKGKEHY